MRLLMKAITFSSMKMITKAVGTVKSRIAVGRDQEADDVDVAATSGARPMTRGRAGHRHQRSKVSDRQSATSGRMTLPASDSLFQVGRGPSTDAPPDLTWRHLSTPPMIGSSDAMTAIVSAIRLPGTRAPTACRLKKDGSWMRSRNGWSEPSLMA